MLSSLCGVFPSDRAIAYSMPMAASSVMIEGSLKKVERIRQDFPETWLWSNLTARFLIFVQHVACTSRDVFPGLRSWIRVARVLQEPFDLPWGFAQLLSECHDFIIEVFHSLTTLLHGFVSASMIDFYFFILFAFFKKEVCNFLMYGSYSMCCMTLNEVWWSFEKKKNHLTYPCLVLGIWCLFHTNLAGTRHSMELACRERFAILLHPASSIFVFRGPPYPKK